MKRTAKETSYNWTPELTSFDYVAYRMEKVHGQAGTSVLFVDVLDAVPSWRRLRRDIDRTSRVLLRMRQRVVVPALPFTSARWVTDPDFDLDYHIRRVSLPEPGGFRQLLDLAATLQATPLDLNRPLWEATLVEGLNEKGDAASIIWKFNHAVIDGVGRLVFERFLHSDKRGPDRAPMPPVPSPEELSSRDITGQAARRLPVAVGREVVRRAGGAISAVPNTIRQPVFAVERATGIFQLLRRVAGSTRAEPQTLPRHRGPNRRFETMEIALADLRGAARKYECSLTDAYVAAVCGALGRYYEKLGMPNDAVQLTMPISLGSGDDPAGGQFWSGVRIAALMGEADPVERMRAVRDAIVAARTEPALTAFGAVAPLVFWLPAQVLTTVVEAVSGTDVLISNAGGHPGPAYVAGVRLTRVVPVAPLAGARIAIVMYSLDSRCHIGVNLDTAAVTEPGLFMDTLQQGFDEVIAAGREVPAGRARRGKRSIASVRMVAPRDGALRQPGAVANIDASHAGPEVGAYFDLDGTLIAGYSARYMNKDPALRMEFSSSELLRTLAHVVSNGIDEATFAELLELGAAAWRGRTLEDLDEMGLRIFENNIRDLIYPEMREIVEAHRRRGHTIVLSSSASSFQVEPVAQYLGIDHVLCNRFVAEQGVLTGEVQRPVVWGPGKASAAQAFAAEHGIDLGRSYFYADGDEDAALMYLVGNPRPTNPGKELARIARKRGWPVQRFNSRGSSPGKLVRNVAGLGVGLPFIGLGVGIGWARGDKRAGINFVFEHWLDAMFLANNVHINVIGEENAWAQRPAVFILNHRTTFDGLIAMHIVRKDFTAVSKAENKGGGPVFEALERLLDVAYVDRSDAASAVAAMKSLEELARNGLSVLIAPEGTRVATAGTGPFKKGAFRLAMAAGLPIVPIVIRNAEAIGGRDAYAMNPGNVDVAVLKPIPVDHWKLEDLPRRIEEVRQLYVDTLANWPRSSAELAGLPADH